MSLAKLSASRLRLFPGAQYLIPVLLWEKPHVANVGRAFKYFEVNLIAQAFYLSYSLHQILPPNNFVFLRVQAEPIGLNRRNREIIYNLIRPNS